ncbi:MAG: hypothetical protein CMK36_06565 [Porticoccaceae bacterium]|nr:hypothetical protein [Porticoccaceae bacterium]
MQTYTIINKSKGSPDNSQNTLLHLYNQTLGSGARVAQGDGTATGLILFANDFGVENTAGFYTKIGTLASADRIVNYPDGNGFIVLGDGTGISSVTSFREALDDQNKILAADFATTNNTPQAVSGFNLAVETNSVYKILAVLRVEGASASYCIRPRLTGPTSSLSYLTARFTANNETFDINAFDNDVNFTSFDAANTPEIMTIEGILATNSVNPSANFGLSIKSEASGQQVKILAGSLLSLKKV